MKDCNCTYCVCGKIIDLLDELPINRTEILKVFLSIRTITLDSVDVKNHYLSVKDILEDSTEPNLLELKPILENLRFTYNYQRMRLKGETDNKNEYQIQRRRHKARLVNEKKRF